MAYEYHEREMVFLRDNKRIVGKLFSPDKEGKTPVVIICHGFAGNLDGITDYAIAFAKEGFTSFVFDFIGGGPNIRSDGTMLDMTVLTEFRDLRVVVDELKKLETADLDNIFLMGESQGGFVTSYFASTYPDEIRALIPFFPAYVIQDDAQKRIAEYGTDLPWIEVMGMKISADYGIDATSFDIYDMLPNYKRNVLIFHGTIDSIVPISYSERAVQTFPSAKLIKVEGADHGFAGKDRVSATQKTIEFIKENIV